MKTDTCCCSALDVSVVISHRVRNMRFEIHSTICYNSVGTKRKNLTVLHALTEEVLYDKLCIGGSC